MATETIVKPIKDPQPSVDRIDDLASRILTGDIYLPKFQREFVWERSQVLELLDSVARNFPIGKVNLSCAIGIKEQTTWFGNTNSVRNLYQYLTA